MQRIIVPSRHSSRPQLEFPDVAEQLFEIVDLAREQSERVLRTAEFRRPRLEQRRLLEVLAEPIERPVRKPKPRFESEEQRQLERVLRRGRRARHRRGVPEAGEPTDDPTAVIDVRGGQHQDGAAPGAGGQQNSDVHRRIERHIQGSGSYGP